MANSWRSGQVHLLSGRPAVADFEIKTNTVPAASALRIIPSTTVLKRNSKAGATGTLKGTARDQAGKPLPRALVSIKGLAVARTDSQGRYAFLNVPAGEHLVSDSETRIETSFNTRFGKSQRRYRVAKPACVRSASW